MSNSNRAPKRPRTAAGELTDRALATILKSSLPLHTDHHPTDLTALGLSDIPGGLVQGQLVLTDASGAGAPGFVCVDRTLTHDYAIPRVDYTPLDAAAVARYGPHAKRVLAPPGAVILWLGTTVHANCKAGNTAQCHPVTDRTHLPRTEATREKLVAALNTAGYCVVVDVIDSDTIARYIAEMAADVARAQTSPGATPKGQAGHTLWKGLGLACTLGTQRRRLNPAVREIFATIYKTPAPALTISTDAFAAQFDTVDGRYVVSPGTVLRAVQLICWAPAALLDRATAQAKLRSFMAGQSVCHNPLRLMSAVGGRHFSDKHHEWDTVPFEGILPEMRAALMGPWSD